VDKQSRKCVEQKGNNQMRSEIRWKESEAERYKCNVDDSFSQQRNCVGVGMSIQDDDGRFVLAKTMWPSPICEIDVGRFGIVTHY
jgi:hypothetical protein